MGCLAIILVILLLFAHQWGLAVILFLLVLFMTPRKDWW